MTTISETTRRPATRRSAVGFRQAARMERIKLRTLRSPWVTLLITVAGPYPILPLPAHRPDPYRAERLTHLGDTQHAAGHRHAARNTWQQALNILRALHDPAAAQLRRRLASNSSSGWFTATSRHSALTLALTARTAFFDE
jgi:hypothetical protein